MLFQVIVVHVGTNNVEHTAEQVCDGILEIIRTIREKHPSAYIVLPVSIFYIHHFFVQNLFLKYEYHFYWFF